MCGEKLQQRQAGQAQAGSPPHVRGKVGTHTARKIAAGITPACAGKSFSFLRSTIIRLDHPRMCGEKQDVLADLLDKWGSPPHVRGKASDTRSPVAMHRDHPRMCGEKKFAVFLRHHYVGSPPHVRGKAKKVDAQNLHQGITPACAGKRRIAVFLSADAADHPRMCGEKA